ncbi:MAG: T9SS type A sorting domain-containing protein [Bacteroidales bacterium]|nr:T9SS type A sorting domain-containing protein [Bacteroidales bacterium]
MITKPSVLFLFIIALMPLIASGIRKYVPDDYPTIQEAINNIDPFDTIVVRPGIYNENLVITDKSVNLFSEFFIANDTSVISQTIIDGNQAGRVIYVNNNNFQSCIINGFTIRNGMANSGGGILCSNHSLVRIEHCKVRQNSSTEYGGGIGVLWNWSIVTISDCEITNNTASTSGGGVVVGNFTRVSITDCLISGNYSGGEGGGIWNCTAPAALDYKFGLSVNRCVITNNTAYFGGGFVNVWTPNEAKIINSTFYNNHANEYSEIGTYGGNSLWIVNTIIYNDSALISHVIGMGALYSSTMRFDNCLIFGGEGTIHLAGNDEILIYSPTNIDTIPYFVDSLNGDFHPEPFSPCIDKAIDTMFIHPHVVQPGEYFHIRIGDVFQIAEVGSVLAGDSLVYIPPDQYYGLMPDIGAFEYNPPITVDEIQQAGGLLIYPNPARNVLTIILPEESDKSRLSIVDLNGKILYEEIIASNAPLITLDISFLSPGMYIVRWANVSTPSGSARLFGYDLIFLCR